MLTALVIANILLLGATGAAEWYVLKKRSLRHQRGIFGPWPIRKVSIEQFDPTFTPNEFGPTLDTEVSLVARGVIGVPGGTDDFESWILAVMSKRAKAMFEFGTCTGKTAYLWARNSPPDARVTTLTLHPSQLTSYSTAAGDAPKDVAYAHEESKFTSFLYSGTEVERKIIQLYGDSKTFDETPYLGACDLIFVDGSHAQSYVESDSQKALRMVRPGGVILWHDYRGPGRSPGVFHVLNRVSKRVPLVHIAGTSLVAYRAPLASSETAS